MLAKHFAVVAIVDWFSKGCSGRNHHRLVLKFARQANLLENHSEELPSRSALSIDDDPERRDHRLTSLAEPA